MQPRLHRLRSTSATNIKQNTHKEAHMHNTNSNTHINAHYTLVFIRKHHSDTKAQTHLRMHTRTHHTHHHTGEDGGACSACSIGKYKSVRASVACSTCPLNANSSAASTNQTDCKCNPGYTGEDAHPRQTQNKISQPYMHNTKYKYENKSTQRTHHF
jgi:hypothetical protein